MTEDRITEHHHDRRRNPRRIRQIGRVGAASLVAGLALAGALAGAATTPAGAATGGTGTFTAAISLTPSTSFLGNTVKASVSRSIVPSGDSLKSIKLTWGDSTKAVSLTSLRATAKHSYHRTGSFTVKVTLTDTHGVSRSAAATEVVRAPGGSYSGPYLYGHYGDFTLYISHDGSHIQDLYVPDVTLTCTPGGAVRSGTIVVDSVGLQTNGSFSSSGHTSGVVASEGANYPATTSYTFTGRVTGLSPSGAVTLAGKLAETETFSDSAARTCSSGTRSWTATRDSQPAQPASAPPAGSYSGPYLYGAYGDFRFFVSHGRSELQDLYVPGVTLYCTPGATVISTPIVVDSVALPANGSFETTVSRTGDYQGHPAAFRYAFRGHVHGVDPSGSPRLAGSLVVTMSYSDSASRSCSSNVQPWSATRDSQPAQPGGAPAAGSYSGPYLYGAYGDFRLFVSHDQSRLQDLWVPGLALTCSPGGATFANRLVLNDVALASDGSFSATAKETGVYDGYQTTFTYLLHGHTQGLDPTGTPRLAGSLLETATYEGSTAESCTSNVQPWYATRDSQPAQTNPEPPAGAYSGPYLYGSYGDFSFQVSADHAELQNISVPGVTMDCAPGGASSSTTVAIPSATIAPDRSFSGTATVTGTYGGVPATWKYSFSGQFQSTGADGNERAAGVLSATLTYTNGDTYSCTSNVQPWSAELG